jgi:aryl-alcohol dehydrogenase-like predicted oxidoreductase
MLNNIDYGDKNNTMKKNKILKTDIEVSNICLGTMTFGSPVGESDAMDLVHYAVDQGINFIDTANMYEGYDRVAGSSGGVAEEILGKALVGKRDQVVLATKLGMKVGDAPEDENTSPAAISKQLDLSLQRLNTDIIDLYYLHKPDPATPMADILGALNEAVISGKIRYYGISNYNAEQLKELLSVADANNLPRPVICQPALSLLKQDALKDLIPLCKRENIAVTPYQILQGGLLTGKYRRGQTVPANSRKAEKESWVWELTDEIYDKLEEYAAEARRDSLSMVQYSIQWILKQEAVVSALIGVKNKKQIDAAINSVN